MASAPQASSEELFGINLSETEMQEIQKWQQQSKSLRIAAVGITGSGKSSLINSLVGQDVAEEGEELATCTTIVKTYRETINGVEVTIWDTPGLRYDEDTSAKSEAIARDIGNTCVEVDLLIYCTQLTNRRLTRDTTATISVITQAFGKEVWDNAVVALTFANDVHPSGRNYSAKEELECFNKRLQMWRGEICKVLNQVSVDQLPIVPTGYREGALPDRRDWINAFWMVCYHKAKTSARPALLNIKTLRIAAVGVTGSGKSTLINSIVGRNVAEEGEALDTSTTIVKAYRATINDVVVTIWDTPGLATGVSSAAMEKEIKDTCRSVDLLIYCKELTDMRVTEDPAATIPVITGAIGKESWNNAVIALTFSNRLERPREIDATGQIEKKHFEEKLQKWRDKLRGILKDQEFTQKTISDLPIVPTGYRKCALPDRLDWVTAFWEACHRKVKKEAKQGLLVLSHNRFAHAESVRQDREEMEPHERPIVTNRYTQQQIRSLIGIRSPGPNKVMLAVACVGGAGIGGAIGGPPGVAIGAAIGVGLLYNYFRN